MWRDDASGAEADALSLCLVWPIIEFEPCRKSKSDDHEGDLNMGTRNVRRKA
jgi:hypothetical protein